MYRTLGAKRAMHALILGLLVVLPCSPVAHAETQNRAEAISEALLTVFDFGTFGHGSPHTEECLAAVSLLSEVGPGEWVINYNLQRRLSYITNSLEPICDRNRYMIEKFGLRYMVMSALAGRTSNGSTLAEALDRELGTNWVSRLDTLREG